jgi:hypothetical protein
MQYQQRGQPVIRDRVGNNRDQGQKSHDGSSVTKNAADPMTMGRDAEKGFV